jgi:hypothetical protein
VSDGTGNSEQLSLSFFQHVTSKTPRVREFTWEQIQAALAHTRFARVREEIGLVCPAVFRPDTPRKQENVDRVVLSMSDLDGGQRGGTIAGWLEGYEFILAETWHSTPEAPRWRLAMPLAEPVPLADFPTYWSRLNYLLHNSLDPSTKDASRMFWLTSAEVGQPERRIHTGRGVPLGWRNLPDAPPPDYKPRPALSLPSGNEDKRAAGVVDSWGFKLGHWAPGSRHQQLLNFAKAGGGLVAAGLINEQHVAEVLFHASEENGLVAEDGETNVSQTIVDGLRYGSSEPWTPAGTFGDKANWTPPTSSPRLGRRRNGTAVSPDDEPLPTATSRSIPDFPLDHMPPLLAEVAATTSLPVAFSMGGALVAVATAIGGLAEITLPSIATLHERAILWCALVGPRASGKSATTERAKEILDRWTRADPERPWLTIGSITLEALARELDHNQGALSIVHGELAASVGGIGQYKSTPTVDQAHFMELWSGAPWTFVRAGPKARTRNETRLRIEQPTMSILGGLVTENVHLLGSEESGMRSRWLPFLGNPLAFDQRERDDGLPEAFRQRILELLDMRQQPRVWQVSGEAEARLHEILLGWRRAIVQPGAPAGVISLLERGVIHPLRVCLVLAELMYPAGRGLDRCEVPRWIVDAARVVIEYCANCWACLQDEDIPLSFNFRDQSLDRAIYSKLLPMLRRAPDQRMRQRDLQRVRIGGARSRLEFKALMERYAALYPGCVQVDEQTHAVWVLAPMPVGEQFFPPDQP